MVDVGEPASDGIGGISKHTLLMGALVIGGGIGLFVFISRKANAPSANAENKAQTDVPVNNMAYQNLAEQLLGFRGDVSVANANLAQGEQDILASNANLAQGQQGILASIGTSSAARASGEQDILSAIGAESSARASGNAQLMGGIQNVMGQVHSLSDSEYAANRNIQASVWQVFMRQTFPNASWDDLVTNNPYLAEPTAAVATPGAGGATPHDAILAAFGANDDDADYYLARMSAGPVRQLTNRSY